jgi:hypothetical protein
MDFIFKTKKSKIVRDYIGKTIGAAIMALGIAVFLMDVYVVPGGLNDCCSLKGTRNTPGYDKTAQPLSTVAFRPISSVFVQMSPLIKINKLIVTHSFFCMQFLK